MTSRSRFTEHTEFHPTFGISNRTGDTVSVDAGYRGADFTLTTSVFPLGGICT